MKLTEQKLNSEKLYSGRIIDLFNDKILLPNGNTAFREYVKHPGGVCVVPITEKGEVLLVRQYRYPYAEEIIEIPAGKRDSGEEPLEGGKRELKEELGVEAENFTFLGEFYPTPGYTDERLYMFAATGLSFGNPNPDQDEFVAPEKYSLNVLVEKIINGEIKDGKTQAAVLKVKHLIDNGLIKL